MSNTLPAKLQDSSVDELMALTGQSTGPKSDFPRLSINKDGTDDSDRQLPVGAYKLSQGGLSVYGKPVAFRPFINAYQYGVYDAESKVTTNRSIIIKSFSDEALDELGGVACGKVPFKKRDQLTKEQLEDQKKIKCYRNVYGLATFDGHTADGQQEKIANLPCKLRLSGDNFMPIQEALDVLAKKKILMLSCSLILTSERRKNGTNIWYRLIAKPDLENLVQITDSDWDVLRMFQESIDNENKGVIEKHKASKKSTSKDGDDIRILNALDADFSDDISHVGN